MKLTTLSDERFTCSGCTNCCRDWHVELLAGEAERITSLSWPTTDELVGANVLLKHGGKTFLAHRPDGSCVFLNLANGRCRIHEQFGGEVKPLGCRLYPFHVSPTTAGEATVTARFDCPEVRGNAGRPHADALPELRELTARMKFARPPDETDRSHLDIDQIEAVHEFIATLLSAFDDDRDRAIFINVLANWLATQYAGDVDREALAKVFPVLREYVLTQRNVKRPGLIHRIAFRALLGLYLRRDEDVLDGRAGRFGRFIAMIRLVLGGGNFQSLGKNHPAGRVRRAKLFSPSIEIADRASTLHWRLISNKLATMQYMGAANGGRDFVIGLRSLAILYPLVLAIAKYRAANRNAPQVEGVDVNDAVAAVDHSYGRQAVAIQTLIDSLESTLGEPSIFARLTRTI